MRQVCIFDAHCHVFAGGAGNVCRAVMSSEETDWTRMVKLLSEESSTVTACVGIHPWFAHRVLHGWPSRLERILENNPSFAIGEIGLDRIAKTPDTKENEFEAQLKVFRIQLVIAGRFNRPVSVHCVKSDGAMIGVFESLSDEEWPPRIMMHSCGNSVETVKSLIKRFGKKTSFYFSFSGVINGRSPKTCGVISAVPNESLLLESDVESNHLEALEMSVRLISKAKEMSREEIIDLTFENAQRFFRIM